MVLTAEGSRPRPRACRGVRLHRIMPVGARARSIPWHAPQKTHAGPCACQAGSSSEPGTAFQVGFKLHTVWPILGTASENAAASAEPKGQPKSWEAAKPHGLKPCKEAVSKPCANRRHNARSGPRAEHTRAQRVDACAAAGTAAPFRQSWLVWFGGGRVIWRPRSLVGHHLLEVLLGRLHGGRHDVELLHQDLWVIERCDGQGG